MTDYYLYIRFMKKIPKFKFFFLFQVVLAKELKMSYAAIAMATDYDCWRENEEGVSVDKVMATFK